MDFSQANKVDATTPIRSWFGRAIVLMLAIVVSACAARQQSATPKPPPDPRFAQQRHVNALLRDARKKELDGDLRGAWEETGRLLEASATEPAYVASGVLAYREELRDTFARALVAEARKEQYLKPCVAKLVEARSIASEKAMPEVEAADATTAEESVTAIQNLVSKEKLLEAWKRGVAVLEVANECRHKVIQDRVTATLDGLFEQTAAAIRASVEDAEKLVAALALMEEVQKALPSRAKDLVELERTVTPARTRLSASLVERGAQMTRGQYAEIERLAGLAARLDPANDRAKRLLEAGQAARADLAPVYVSDIRTRRDGAGLKIEFSLKTKSEKYTIVPGRASVRFEVTSDGFTVADLGGRSFEVTDANYKQRGNTIFVDLPRIAFSDLEDTWSGQGVGSGHFAAQLRDEGCRVTVEVAFFAAGEQRGIAGTETLTYFAFR